MPALAGNSRSEPPVAVELVPVCHAGGRGFESRRSRLSKCLQIGMSVVRPDARRSLVAQSRGPNALPTSPANKHCRCKACVWSHERTRFRSVRGRRLGSAGPRFLGDGYWRAQTRRAPAWPTVSAALLKTFATASDLREHRGVSPLTRLRRRAQRRTRIQPDGELTRRLRTAARRARLHRRVS
jgi:hypothetical protein